MQNNIATSLRSVATFKELVAWFDDDTSVYSHIGNLGGRRFCKNGFDGSLALKDLIQKVERLAESASIESQDSFSEIMRRICLLNEGATRKRKVATLFQRILTAVRRFFGNFWYSWQRALCALQEKQIAIDVSKALSVLDKALSHKRADDDAIKQFVRDNIQEMVRKARKNGESLARFHLHGAHTIWLKSKYDDQGLQCYIRIPRISGGVKDIEQRIVMLGQNVGTQAYAKPIKRGGGTSTRDGLLEMAYESEKAESMLGSKHIISVREEVHRKNPSVLKATCSPWTDEGDLWECLHNRERLLSDREKLSLTIDMLQGLAWMHKKNMVHLDLKPPNVLLFSDGEHPGRLRAVLGDFGRTTDVNQMQNEVMSTIPYCPPEELFPGGWRAQRAIDMWAIGLILLELWQGKDANLYLNRNYLKSPDGIPYVDADFDDPAKFEEIQRTWHSVCATILENMIDQPIAPLIRRFLSVDASERPSAEEALEDLKKIFPLESSMFV